MAQAETLLREALTLHERAGNISGILWMLHELAATAAARRQPEKAVMLSGAGDRSKASSAAALVSTSSNSPSRRTLRGNSFPLPKPSAPGTADKTWTASKRSRPRLTPSEAKGTLAALLIHIGDGDYYEIRGAHGGLPSASRNRLGPHAQSRPTTPLLAAASSMPTRSAPSTVGTLFCRVGSAVGDSRLAGSQSVRGPPGDAVLAEDAHPLVGEAISQRDACCSRGEAGASEVEQVEIAGGQQVVDDHSPAQPEAGGVDGEQSFG